MQDKNHAHFFVFVIDFFPKLNLFHADSESKSNILLHLSIGLQSFITLDTGKII